MQRLPQLTRGLDKLSDALVATNRIPFGHCTSPAAEDFTAGVPDERTTTPADAEESAYE
jgi:hypothetical protein